MSKDSIFGGWDGAPHFPKRLSFMEEGSLVSPSHSPLMVKRINLEGFSGKQQKLSIAV